MNSVCLLLDFPCICAGNVVEHNRQLGKIRANLNQIAKYFNQTSRAGIIDDYQVQEAVDLELSL